MASPAIDLLARDRDALAARLERLELVAAERLARWQSGTNLLTYEGTLLDRLSYELVCRNWRADEFDVLCSVRPCMLPELVDEVRAFAEAHHYPIADFAGDCSARYPWLAEQPRSCENVSGMIRARLAGTRGLLVSAALLNAGTEGAFRQVNREYADLYAFDAPALARHRNAAGEQDWRILFLFQGFEIADVICGYLRFVSDDLAPRHLPVCYLDCYNEDMQRQMLRALPSLTPLIR